MPPHGNALISVIMVTYNSQMVVLDSILPLVAQEDIELIVVENNSADNTFELLERLAPTVRILRNSANVGFAKAVNRGAKQARGNVLVLLNPDAVVEPDDLRLLCSRLQDDAIGVVGPVIQHPGGRLKILSAGRLPSAWRMFCHYAGLSRLFKETSIFEGHYLLPSRKRHGLVDVEWVTGACLAVRKSTWDQLGGLSERWFMYAEDIEFCHRADGLALRICLDTSVSASHLVGASSGSMGDTTNSAWILNLYDFYRTSMRSNVITAAAWRVAVAGGLMSRSLVYRAAALRSGSTEASRSWRAESRRFAAYSRAVLVARSHGPLSRRADRSWNSSAVEAPRDAT